MFAVAALLCLASPLHPFSAPSRASVPAAAADTLYVEEKAVSDGRCLILERLEITGNLRLDAAKIAASLAIAPGDTIDAGILERERRRLIASNRMVLAADFSAVPGSRRGLVVLRIDVEEDEPINFETGYGYHDRYGWFMTLVGLRVERPFNTDSRVRLGLRAGFHVAGLEAEWKKHNPPDGGLGYGARLYLYNEDHIFFGNQDPGSHPEGEPVFTWEGAEWRNYSQEITRSGFEAAIDYTAAGGSFSFGVGMETVKPDTSFEDVESDLEGGLSDFPEAMRPDIETTLLTGLFFRLIRDTRDSFIYPVRGSYTYLKTQATSTILGGDRVFSKTRFDHTRHVDLGEDRALALRIAAGWASGGAPYYERFSLGGIYSIRGYRELSLSPTTGSDGFWIFGGEIRVPLIDSPDESPRLSGLLFLDAGQGWQRGDSPSIDEIFSSAGYGIRLRLPWLGTLGIDAGIPLSANGNGDNYRIHGSLGFSF